MLPLTTEQKTLIKILDNTRSTYAFFAKKVLLVEGDSDRYFYRAAIHELYPELEQEIAILYMGGKGGYKQWSELFRAFGLTVFFAGDLDCIINIHYPAEKSVKLKTPNAISEFKSRNPDWETKVDQEYANGIFILKEGDLEQYLRIPKELSKVIDFCNNNLKTFLTDNSNTKSIEVREILKNIKG